MFKYLIGASQFKALNPLLGGGGKDNFIKLPTGEVITRHLDCVIAFTVNSLKKVEKE